jgi:hypothetical protein
MSESQTLNTALTDMAKPNYTIQKACQVLRRRVRYDRAALRLESTRFPKDDTAEIREATRLYVETWIVPLLDMIEVGDTRGLRDSLRLDRGHPLGSPSHHKLD